MLRYIFPVCFTLLVTFAVTGCNNNSNPNNNNGSAPTEVALKGNWYKRYTGTIAGQAVVVNMYCYTDNGNTFAGGTYYYAGKSELLGIAVTNDALIKNELHIKEWIAASREETPDSLYNTWTVTIDGSNATGKFTNGITKKSYDISLHEDYAHATPLTVVGYADSLAAPGPKWTGHANASYTIAEATGPDAAAINQLILTTLGNDSGKIKALHDLPKYHVNRALTQFKSWFEDEQKDGEDEERLQEFYTGSLLLPVYNDRDLLVLENSVQEFSGGAHPNHASSFVTIDVKEKKLLKLGDILTVDSTAISAILNNKVRAVLHIPASAALEDNIIAATVPATDNFVITDKGLTFCYSPYEIASYADGDVWLFIPYSQLKVLLKPDFVLRMGLKL